MAPRTTALRVALVALALVVVVVVVVVRGAPTAVRASTPTRPTTRSPTRRPTTQSPTRATGSPTQPPGQPGTFCTDNTQCMSGYCKSYSCCGDAGMRPQCLSCDSMGLCSLCDRTTVLVDGYCVPPPTNSPTLFTSAPTLAGQTFSPTAAPVNIALRPQSLQAFQAFYDATNGKNWRACSTLRNNPCLCHTTLRGRYIDVNCRNGYIVSIRMNANNLKANAFPVGPITQLVNQGLNYINIMNNNILPGTTASCVTAPACLLYGMQCDISPLVLCTPAPVTTPTTKGPTRAPIAAPPSRSPTVPPPTRPPVTVTTSSPTLLPTKAPVKGPTSPSPTQRVTPAPTSRSPSRKPTAFPSQQPSTHMPTFAPTRRPTTLTPTSKRAPTSRPTTPTTATVTAGPTTAPSGAGAVSTAGPTSSSATSSPTATTPTTPTTPTTTTTTTRGPTMAPSVPVNRSQSTGGTPTFAPFSATLTASQQPCNETCQGLAISLAVIGLLFVVLLTVIVGARRRAAAANASSSSGASGPPPPPPPPVAPQPTSHRQAPPSPQPAGGNGSTASAPGSESKNKRMSWGIL